MSQADPPTGRGRPRPLGNLLRRLVLWLSLLRTAACCSEVENRTENEPPGYADELLLVTSRQRDHDADGSEDDPGDARVAQSSSHPIVVVLLKLLLVETHI